MRDLINELKDLKRKGKLVAEERLFKGNFSPLSDDEIAVTEADIGFSLPNLLKRIYTEVANGGFGPDYGLLGLKGGMLDDVGKDAVNLYLAYRNPRVDDPYWFWPEKLLPLGYLGCGMYYCIDCSKESLPVIWFEPNPHVDGTTWDSSFVYLVSSFEEWIFSYIDEEDTFKKYFGAHLQE